MSHRKHKKKKVNKKKLIISIVAGVLTAVFVIAGIIFIAKYDDCFGDNTPGMHQGGQNNAPGVGDPSELPMDPL